MTGRLAIEEITPTVDDGEHPAKAVVGEVVPIGALAYREGHESLGVTVVWVGPDGRRRRTRMSPGAAGTDRWQATIRPDAPGSWTFTLEAFHDPFLTWRHAVMAKLEAGQGAAELANDLETGARILDAAAAARVADTNGVASDGVASGAIDETVGRDLAALREAAAALRDPRTPVGQRVQPALGLQDLMWLRPVRELVTQSAARRLWVDRPRALFSAWYELFPRSEGAVTDLDGRARRSGTLADAALRLPAIAAMGFDVVYLPPIHPIGRINRKGRNNSLITEPGDVGSPWAIGADEGGHDAVHPDLGTLADLRAFVARAAELDIEVALDLALQCAPDHPWVREHPEWFTTRPDGSIAYAENPPKKYQDIYPINFDNDPEGIRAEVLRVVVHWIDQGVRIFRVDNPHTKPIDMWHWLIWRVKQDHPDVLFLAEAFTRPAMMHGLGRVGFTQSYTYFTWRTTAADLRDYCQELVASIDHMRPNFWPNTPDILPEQLQHGGPAMFAIRAVLASMLSPSWGVYSGYELFEHDARPDSEDYQDSEKYQLRPRPWAAAEEAGETLAPLIAALNRIRRDNPALRWLRNLRFHDVDNDSVLCWSKRDPDTGNTVLVVCLLDSRNAHWANTSLTMPDLGFDWHERMRVHDQLTGDSYVWGQHNAVHLDPRVRPAHIFTVHRLSEPAPPVAAAPAAAAPIESAPVEPAPTPPSVTPPAVTRPAVEPTTVEPESAASLPRSANPSPASGTAPPRPGPRPGPPPSVAGLSPGTSRAHPSPTRPLAGDDD